MSRKPAALSSEFKSSTTRRYCLPVRGRFVGDVQAEKFIALIQREPFDYTRWQRTLWPDKNIEEISQAAMKHWSHN